MVDMGQADRSLRQRPTGNRQRMCWPFALQKAASALGYGHYIEVPDSSKQMLRATARAIQLANQ